MAQPSSRMEKRQQEAMRKQQELVKPRMPEFHQVKTEANRKEDIIVGLSVAFIMIGSIAGGLYFLYTKLPF